LVEQNSCNLNRWYKYVNCKGARFSKHLFYYQLFAAF
jgi:hypothetical protein